MPSEEMDIAAVDGLFADHEQIAPTKQSNEIITVSLDELYPFPGHPFRVMMDADMDKLTASIRNNGVLVPAIIRPRRKGGYEIISGHRRKEAARLAGQPTIPAELRRDLDDNAATLIMIESNLKTRQKLLPSERAKAYRMMRDALTHQGIRFDEDQKTTKRVISEQFGESAANVMRAIRLTELNQQLLDMVDNGKLKLGLAVQISYLDTEVQCWITDHNQEAGIWPSASQVKELRALFEQGGLTQDAFADVMNRGQPAKQRTEKDDFVASIRDEHFPDMTVEDVKQKLLELIEQYQHRKRMGM